MKGLYSPYPFSYNIELLLLLNPRRISQHIIPNKFGREMFNRFSNIIICIYIIISIKWDWLLICIYLSIYIEI